MKLVSWNVNGVRAIARKGFLDWLETEQPDVVCLQEVKAFLGQLPPEIRSYGDYHVNWHAAQRPGYSGVATFSKEQPVRVAVGFDGPDSDPEGRLLLTEFRDFSLVNGYFPHSRRDLSRLEFKMSFCERFLKWTQGILARGKPVIVCGDFNTAHTALDLANPKGNKRNAGFLPEERAWFDRFLEIGFADVFRDRCSDGGHYTWWSNRKGVRERNVGWRIDYHCVSHALAARIRSAYHQPQVLGSDHCPVILTLDS